MSDEITNKPILVRTCENAVPYITIFVDQVQDVRKILDANDVSYWEDEVAVSLDGKRMITVINLEHSADPVAIQNLLNDAS